MKFVYGIEYLETVNSGPILTIYCYKTKDGNIYLNENNEPVLDARVIDSNFTIKINT